MDQKASNNALPTEMRTERLILRAANCNNDIDCARINYVRGKTVDGVSTAITSDPNATRELQYKARAHGARQELCTLAPAPDSIYWLFYLASSADKPESEPSDLVGVICMSFREEMPYPDMGYITVAAHAGKGYAAEAGKQLLHYWRDLVGVKEIFIACASDNRPSQRCAERIGFVHAGGITVELGRPPEGKVEEDAVALVLPGMSWKDGVVISPWKGWPLD